MTKGAPQEPPGRVARGLWLAYAIATILASLAVLAIYVMTYDDYDLSDRLRAVGRFARRAMRVLSFPLGLPIGALLNGPLEAAFACGDEKEPCAVFIDWHTHFAALVAQVALLRWLIVRRSKRKISAIGARGP